MVVSFIQLYYFVLLNFFFVSDQVATGMAATTADMVAPTIPLATGVPTARRILRAAVTRDRNKFTLHQTTSAAAVPSSELAAEVAVDTIMTLAGNQETKASQVAVVVDLVIGTMMTDRCVDATMTFLVVAAASNETGAVTVMWLQLCRR